MHSRFGKWVAPAILACLMGCSNPLDRITASSDVMDTSSRAIILQPGDSRLSYLGGGCDILKNEEKAPGVVVNGGYATVGNSSTIAKNFVVKNSYELLKALNTEFGANANLSLFGALTLEGSLKKTIIKSTKFSSNKITYVAELLYDHAKIATKPGSVVIDPDALNEYRDLGLSQFISDYGVGYVDSVLLGERLYITLTIDGTNVESYLKKKFEIAANMKFKTIIGGGTSSVTDEEVKKIWTQLNITANVTATGGFIPPACGTTPEEFSQIYSAFAAFVQRKVDGSSTVPFSVVAASYKSYAPLLGTTFTNLDACYRMILEWEKTKARIEIVYNDATNPALRTDCENALALIEEQIGLCKNLDPAARYPAANEFAAIDDQWLRMASTITYCLHVQEIGWGQGWVLAGQTGGSATAGRRVEAIMIKLPEIAPYGWTIAYQPFVDKMGWMGISRNGEMAGTTGTNRRIETLKVWLENCPSNLTIKYRSFCKGLGWQPWVADGALSGTTGQGIRIEAFEAVIDRK